MAHRKGNSWCAATHVQATRSKQTAYHVAFRAPMCRTSVGRLFLENRTGRSSYSKTRIMPYYVMFAHTRYVVRGLITSPYVMIQPLKSAVHPQNLQLSGHTYYTVGACSMCETPHHFSNSTHLSHLPPPSHPTSLHPPILPSFPPALHPSPALYRSSLLSSLPPSLQGFHRYFTDRFWHVPHFEKMLDLQSGTACQHLCRRLPGEQGTFSFSQSPFLRTRSNYVNLSCPHPQISKDEFILGYSSLYTCHVTSVKRCVCAYMKCVCLYRYVHACVCTFTHVCECTCACACVCVA